MFSFVGDTVLDPFSGSGTTMLAAMAAGRNSIGVEIDPEYCKAAVRRLTDDRSIFANVLIEFEPREPLHK